MRTYLSTALIVLLTVLAPLSAVAAWVDLEIGDTDRFVSTMAPLASDPDVQNAVADRITDEVLTEVDVGPLLQNGVRGLLHDAVLSFETTNAFKNAWKTATRAAHATAEHALTSGGGNAVTIDLAPITARVKKQLTDDSVPYANRIPVRHTQIIVLEANGLGIWRDVTQGLRAAGIWPAVGTLALTCAAALLAVRRRRALIGAGIAYAAGAALLFLVVAVARGSILQDLPDNGDRSAAAAIFDALTASLRTAGWCVLGGGVALALGAWLSGRLPRARHTPHIAPSALRSSSHV
ncbi:hypothetical protein [Streptomyces scopuliridis]|uniref:Integral membrane protein n=1 Tax=Streptomyces scopuliridis RB72 TaxID=1440053 RepID=A0A2T7TG90_9ACTN|nr:hypothetical protein [Streptomyces scopuliridis]PVE14173.1 hypothetical protein Y717_15225 [Streptomyces scopuliridis RB72]